MWKILGCLFVLGLAGQALGQALFSGTLKSGGMCLQSDGKSVGATDCVELIVLEDSGNFKLQTLLGDPRTELKLDVAANENSFAAIGSGSVVKFTNFANDATSITKADLTDDSAPFYIRLSTEATTPGMCVKSDGTALVACAENTDVWSFEEVNCKVTSCATCNADALLCDACDTNKITNAGKTECQDCSELNAQCTACTETGGTKSCTACAAGYVTDDTDVCAACPAGEISNNNVCEACAVGQIANNNVCEDCAANQIVTTNTCTDCASGKTPHSDRVQCVDECTVDNCLYCDAAAATCSGCDAGYILADSACTKCEEEQYVEGNVCKDCASGKTVNSARDGCVDACTDSNCKFCDGGPGTCGTCNDGYKVEDGECKDESEGTTAENTAAGVVPLRVLLVVVVLTVALLI